VVEHDILMGLFMADRVVTYSGDPGVSCTAHTPTDKDTGLNQFLKTLDITIRQDPDTLRPRINKPHSVADREQKSEGLYYKTTASRIPKNEDVTEE
jgi:ATP-binding cassette subfamily E protein 1